MTLVRRYSMIPGLPIVDKYLSNEWNWSSKEPPQPQASQSALSTEELISPVDRQWLHTIYESVFETIFGSWMGRYSNPFAFGEHSLSDMSVSIRRLCRQLDKWMDEGYDNPGAILDFGTPSDSTKRQIDLQIDQSLDHAIEAFAARWLPLTSRATSSELSSAVVIRGLWRCAHKDMLKVINRPSYRSMLTLLLFALTPIPAGISDEEELDRVPGQVCVHAALQQIQELRAHHRSLQFNGNRVTFNIPTRAPSASPHSLAMANFINAESTAYWAALTFDTSASLTLSCRPLLSSGLFGFESESSWRMVRACMEIFRQMTKGWNDAEFEMTDERANIIIAAGAAWKLLTWKLTANLKESLRDGHDEAEVSRAFISVSDSIDRFNVTYRDLLCACQRRIHFLNQETKFRWYELMLHYHLCILMLVDIVAATDRQDLLSQFSAKRVDAESWVMNCLVFGLNNKYTLTLQPDFAPADPNAGHVPPFGITASLIAIDPYAHHVVAAVKLMQQAVDRDFAAGKISADTYRNLLSTLIQTLGQLPQGSKSVRIVRAELERAEIPSHPLYNER
ncbi:uncharacterized protein Z518_04467 [Rhinocladiella mackenziei CBS 650.93]|uniref:Transcription factor domain-containing protein n=1 Tax=Rhinocladiella mackenziei CBS 650.93 TaxID=1442369 RepID=A0A0D2ITK9_9EURO|nr:uncharacterized protein Z518_04467 [Rhinocladiella mackenziei CBS 650.93]KIX06491.1 hypothetical protein Z518_04467 [Rhinocladiella mackenziei CBS 650.93]